MAEIIVWEGQKKDARGHPEVGLEVQGVIYILKLLSTKTEVAPCNHRRGVVENLRELDEGHLAMFAGRVDDLTAEGLAKTMGAKVFYIKVILRLDGLELAVDHLRGYHLAEAIQEAELIRMSHAEGAVAVADMLLKGGVDLDLAALARLLLDERKTWPTQQMIPRKSLKIRDAQTKETAAANKKR